MCDYNGKEKKIVQISFDIRHGGNYNNNWDLKRFTNIYIT
jgi:hypothetical protein